MGKTIERGLRYMDSYELEGDKVRVQGEFQRWQDDAYLPPDTEFSVRCFGHGLPISITFSAFPKREVMARLFRTGAGTTTGSPQRPTPTWHDESTKLPESSSQSGHFGFGEFDHWEQPPTLPQPPPTDPGGGGGGGGSTHAAVTLKIFAPGMTEPLQTLNMPGGTFATRQHVEVHSPGLPGPDSPYRRVGWWRIVMTVAQPDPAEVYLAARGVVARVPKLSKTITKRLFGTVFRLALDALVPKVELGGSTVRLSLGDELLAMAGKSGVHETFHVPVSVSQSKLQSIKIDALAGRDLLAAADKLHRKSQFTQVKPDDIALRIQAAFDKPIDITFDAVITELDVAHLNGEIGEVWLAFNAQLTQLTPLSHIAIDFSTLSGVALSVASVFTDINHHVVDDKIEGLLRGTDASQLIRTYLREVLSRALGPTSVVIDVHGTAEGWVLEYYDNPFPDEHYRPRPDAGETAPHGPLGGGALPTVDTSTLSPPTESAPPPPPGGGPPPPSSDPLGVWPTEFLVAGGPALTRLDRVKTLIFVMMENRSFDHMLGDLQRVRPRPNDRYDCSNSLDYAATNPTTGGLEGPIRLRTAASIGLGTAIPVSPHHHIDRVLFQIGGGDSSTLATGAMQGFTRDLTDRTDSSQIAMTYYQEAQVPTYYRLADEFKVCDRWFAALPGATWPNRWATLMGTIPEIDNIPSDDPRIGFLKGPTIFDTLSAYNIDWRVYEASLSIIRMFDKYRLDDRHVLPLFDETDGLAALLKSNQALPRVLFVEPRFVDIPPLSLATDDHPPADVAHGQQFIADLCNLLWSTNRWEDVSLFITYDEHGGFYDHVPPPGSPKGPPELVGTIAKLHPDAPAMLGVRVPSFVVSPYVNTASVSHETYDHTSILKTILVHNRAKLPQHVFTSFGPRVNAATHLGTALDRDTPRPAPAAFKRGRPGTTVTPPHGPLTPPITPTVVTAHPPISHPPIITHPPVVTTQPPLPHAPPGHGPLPPTTPPGTLAPPAGGSPAAPPPLAAIGNSAAPETKEPNDFHLALRQALKPKRRT